MACKNQEEIGKTFLTKEEIPYPKLKFSSNWRKIIANCKNFVKLTEIRLRISFLGRKFHSQKSLQTKNVTFTKFLISKENFCQNSYLVNLMGMFVSSLRQKLLFFCRRNLEFWNSRNLSTFHSSKQRKPRSSLERPQRSNLRPDSESAWNFAWNKSPQASSVASKISAV